MGLSKKSRYRKVVFFHKKRMRRAVIFALVLNENFPSGSIVKEIFELDVVFLFF